MPDPIEPVPTFADVHVMKTRVVHCKRERYDIYAGRPSKWGNPFRVVTGDRVSPLEKYQVWIMRQPHLLEAISELRGKVIACWCKPPAGFCGRLMCHAQILAGLADGMSPESVE